MYGVLIFNTACACECVCAWACACVCVHVKKQKKIPNREKNPQVTKHPPRDPQYPKNLPQGEGKAGGDKPVDSN